MDSMAEIYLDRANNELLAAQSHNKLSEDAKAMLLTRGVKTGPPNVHKKTYDEFERVLVKTGILDMKLLSIYKTMVIRADDLLGIFMNAKKGRGKFTYKTIPQANKEPAEESMRNAKTFLAHIGKVIRHK